MCSVTLYPLYIKQQQSTEINQHHGDSEIHKSRLEARKQTHRYGGQIGEKQIKHVQMATETSPKILLFIAQIFKTNPFLCSVATRQ